MTPRADIAPATSAGELKAAIAAEDFSDRAATVVGYGNMGRQFVKALRRLGVGVIRVVSRSERPLAELEGVAGVTTVAGGYRRVEKVAVSDELAIVATPTADLVAAALHLADCGYRRILVEKPVALGAARIDDVATVLEQQGVDAVSAYNRTVYPSFHETRARVEQEGGITSCTYTFTEFVDGIGPGRFPDEELARWGIANSLHVMSMAHGLIGPPARWTAHRSGSLAWHPTGAVFTGSGVSERGIAFAYHADWGSTGRWSIEVHTARSSYRLCPLETLKRHSAPTAEWEDVAVDVFAPEVKAGIVEEVAAMLSDEVRRRVHLVSLREAATLAHYGEDVFGYPTASTPAARR